MKSENTPAASTSNSNLTRPNKPSDSRRDFLRKSSIVGASTIVPYVWTSRYARAIDANSKPTIAAIGVGGSRGRYNRGGTIARQAARFGQMISVCDVDDVHTTEFNEKVGGGKLTMYRDYRKLFEKEKPDIVTIGTPDHWHVPIAIAAMRAGADVYCEKPLTLTLAEGPLISKVVKETGRVFQVGTQQRTEMWGLFQYATAIVQSGRLGKNVNAHIGIDASPVGGPFKTTQAPADLDWDLWLGPAPQTDYSLERRKFFRWYLEYSGGKMTDWGAHHIDIAQWAIGLSDAMPSKISGTGKMTPVIPDDFDWKKFLDGETELPNAYNAATEFHINLGFAKGNSISVNHRYENGSTRFGNGILFEGEKGRMFVNRGKLQGSIVKELFGANLESRKSPEGKRINNYAEAINNLDPSVRDEFDAAFQKLHKGKKSSSHMKNFFDCLDDRGEPISDVDSHVNMMASCHLCNIALMLGRDLNWDQKTNSFIGDEQANSLRSRKRRKGFELEA